MIRMKQHILILLGLAVLCLQSASADNWQIIASPNGSRQVNELHSVSALAENDVWAVGTAPTSTNTVLILHWNGTSWSSVPNPTNGIPLTNLAALAVISANDIWAVGSGVIGDESATATLHWNGIAWSVILSPNVGPEVDNSLAGIAAVFSNDVWAVGTQQPTNLTDPSTLILHWDASAWTIAPNISPDGGHLLAAAAVGSSDVWATGFSELGTLAEHWDGNSWTIVQTPAVRGGEALFLPSVVALGSNNVWTVGEFFQTGFSRSRTLTEQWKGTSWAVVQSPNFGADHNELFGVDASPGRTLWAVGTVYNYPPAADTDRAKAPISLTWERLLEEGLLQFSETPGRKR
jgi:hypothetical protein